MRYQHDWLAECAAVAAIFGLLILFGQATQRIVEAALDASTVRPKACVTVPYEQSARPRCVLVEAP